MGSADPFFVFPILLIYSIIITVAMGFPASIRISDDGAECLVTGSQCLSAVKLTGGLDMLNDNYVTMEIEESKTHCAGRA